jgi:hypothetical protein
MVDAAILAAAEALDEVLQEATGSPIGSPDTHQELNEGIATNGEGL